LFLSAKWFVAKSQTYHPVTIGVFAGRMCDQWVAAIGVDLHAK